MSLLRVLIAAVTAAAVSSGVAVTSQRNTTEPFNPYGDFVPPTCEVEPTMKIGHVELQIQGFTPETLEDQTTDY